VYGLGADATNPDAISAVFEAKGRPRFNPMIIHVPGATSAAALVEFDDRAVQLSARFWPGALTMVLPRRADCTVARLAGAGLETLAVRAPNHAVAQTLLTTAGGPIAAPSANPSGTVSPTTAGHVADSLGRAVAMILDGGPCPLGLESTVLDLSGVRPRILRPGGVTAEDIARVIGPVGTAAENEDEDTARASPGMMARHYATQVPLRCDVAVLEPDEALLAFGAHGFVGAAAELNLSPSGNLREAAANLFAMLHALDRPEFSGIAVMPVPDEGLGRAINDRLRRARHSGPLAEEDTNS
jgi:L-threonylcarbamoyladenylate synthase